MKSQFKANFFFFCKELIDIYHRIDGGTFFEAIKISHKISSFKIEKKIDLTSSVSTLPKLYILLLAKSFSCPPAA